MIIDLLNMVSVPRVLITYKPLFIAINDFSLILGLNLFGLRPENMFINLLFILSIVVFHFKDCIEIRKFRISLKLFLLVHVLIGVVKDVILWMKKRFIFIK